MAEDSPVRPDPDLIRSALSVYEGLDGQVSIWVLYEVHGRNEHFRYGTTSSELDRATRDVVKVDTADEPVGIYLRGTTVSPDAPGRGEADDSVTWIHFRADLDLGKPGGPDNWTQLFDAFGRARLPEPTDWQRSGRGYYPRWQLAEPVADSADVRTAAKRIETELKRAWHQAGFSSGVDACADAARVWRLAGTVHRKDRDQPVTSTVGKPSGRVYTIDELTAVLPEDGPDPISSGTGDGAHVYTPGRADQVVADALDRIRRAVPGQGRGFNNTLNESCMTLGHLAVNHLGWTEQDAFARACALVEPVVLAGPGALAGWRKLNGADKATIRSGLTAGMARPDQVVSAGPAPLLVAEGPCEDGYVLDGLTEPWDGHGRTARQHVGEPPAVADESDDRAALDAAYEADATAERALTLELGSVAEAKALLAERRRREAREILDAEHRPPLRPLEDVLVWGDEMDDVAPPAFAVEELIPDCAVGWLGGPSGSYKSFVAVQLMFALCRGVPALGHREFAPIRRHKVLYVAAEGATGVVMRARAALAHLGLEGTRDHLIWREAVDFTDERALDRMLAVAVEHGFTFIIADTWRQVTPGVDENANTDVSLILRRLLTLRDTEGVSSLLLDHTNKSAKGLADLGGAGAKRANADYVLMMDLPNGERGRGEQRVLRVAKLKDWEDGRSWPIRLEPVDSVADDKGRPSAVAVVGEVDRPASDIHGDDDWREIPVPDDIRDYAGVGREDLPMVARLVMFHSRVQAGSGISRAEALKLFSAEFSDLAPKRAWSRVDRAWDALHALGRIQSVNPNSASRTAHHQWVDVPDLPVS